MGNPRIHREAIERLGDYFSGRLVSPESVEFDEVRSIFNGMIDSRPALVAQCTSPEDVSAALGFATDNQLEVAVRAGGHSVAGMSTVDDGLVVDVRPLKGVDIDAEERVARVGAGATWGEFDARAQAHGLATTGGRVSTTGVAGFTLGGGSGWIERRCGLACDNLVSVDLVLANCQKVRASAAEHRDFSGRFMVEGGTSGWPPHSSSPSTRLGRPSSRGCSSGRPRPLQR